MRSLLHAPNPGAKPRGKPSFVLSSLGLSDMIVVQVCVQKHGVFTLIVLNWSLSQRGLLLGDPSI
jgi:hypothetical protein